MSSCFCVTYICTGRCLAVSFFCRKRSRPAFVDPSCIYASFAMRRFAGLHHFGPLEQPRLVAADVLTFFRWDAATASTAGSPAGSARPLANL